MNIIHDLGISFILFLQGLGTWLTGPMQTITALGYGEFYLIIAPAFLWCIDAQIGLHMGIYLMISGGINDCLKFLFHQPRPYWIDRRVHAFSTDAAFGFPSGHSQNAVVLWGTLAAFLHRHSAWIAAMLLAFLIGLSRLYLGVHFPTDVLAGWLAGALVLYALLRSEPVLLAWLKPQSRLRQVGWAFAGSILLILAGVLIRLALVNWEIPASWAQNAAAAMPDSNPITPFALGGLVASAATFFGLAAGAIWLAPRGGYRADGTWEQRLLRYPVGLIGIAVCWLGLGLLIPHGEDIISMILRYIRYGLVGFWVSGLAPWFFYRLKLAQPNRQP